MDNTRRIKYMEPGHDYLDEVVEMALNSTMEENFIKYTQVISAQLAMQGIDYQNHPVKRKIYYINEEGSTE